MPTDNHSVEFKGAEGHRLADMSGVLLDFRTTAGMLAHLFRQLDEDKRNHPIDHSITQALLDSAIIHYGRCFKKGVRHAFLDVNKWAVELLPDAAQIHIEAIALRDKHIAHSVNDWELNVPVVRVRIDRDSGIAQITGVSVTSQAVSMPSHSWLNALREIAIQFADRTETAMQEEKARLLAIAREKTPEYWARRMSTDQWRFPGTRGIAKDRRKP